MKIFPDLFGVLASWREIFPAPLLLRSHLMACVPPPPHNESRRSGRLVLAVVAMNGPEVALHERFLADLRENFL